MKVLALALSAALLSAVAFDAVYAQTDDDLPVLDSVDVLLVLDAVKTLGDSPLAEVELLKQGQLTPLAGLARSIPVPPDVDEAFLQWKSAAQFGYHIELTSSDESIMTDPVLDVPLVGILPTQRSEITVTHECVGEGTAEVNLRMFFFEYEGQYDDRRRLDGEGGFDYVMTAKTVPIEVVYAKDCTPGGGQDTALPSMCQGSSLSGTPAFGGPINVASWNVAGFLNTGAASETSVSQAREVARVLSDPAADYSVAVVFDAWAPEFVDTLAAEMEDAGFEDIVDVIKPVDSDATSGMMLFSKLPVRGCFYEVFDDRDGTDVVKNIGVFGALIDAGAGFSYLLVAAQGNTDPWDYKAVREAQFEQIADATNVYIEGLVDVTCDSRECEIFGGSEGMARMGVILTGTLNVNDVAYDASGAASDTNTEAYVDALDALRQSDIGPRDWHREANGEEDFGFTTIPLDVTCPEDGQTDFFECEAGEQVVFPGSRVDYMMSWDVVKGYPDDYEMNVLTVSEFSVTTPESTSDASYLTIGDDDVAGISFHRLLSATVEHKSLPDEVADDEAVTEASRSALSVLAAASCALIARRLA